MANDRFLDYKTFMRRRYGEALYRIPVDLGFGCPHRDQNGAGGCSFCAEDGGRARQTVGVEALSGQVAAGMTFARQRYGAQQFMLYVQAYTGTFADPAALMKWLRELLRLHPFVALAVGTRPDCLNEEVVARLATLDRRIETWIELGVQSTHDATLARLNRGHDWASAREAILRLAATGLKVAPHLIVGLPGENRSHWQETARRLAEMPIAAIKLHTLHVVADTRLATEYKAEPFPVLDEHRYAAAIIEILRRLPPDLPLMRLTTDTPPEKLVAPKWTLSKGQFLAFLERQMVFQNVRQGDLFEGGRGTSRTTANPFTPLPTEDGSATFWSAAFKEHYHSKIGAKTEAADKFVKPARLRDKLADGDVRLLDVCFGLGYNTLLASDLAASLQAGRLLTTGLEIDANVVAAAARHLRTPQDASFDWTACLTRLVDDRCWTDSRCEIELLIGDARATLDQAVELGGPFDVVFLDAFSTQRNAELWTLDFFRRLKSALSGKGVLLTYCAALPVRSALLLAGFQVGATPAVGRQRGGTIAALHAADIALPIPAAELEMIAATARGIPYRDPRQIWSNRQILKHREAQRAADNPSRQRRAGSSTGTRPVGAGKPFRIRSS